MLAALRTGLLRGIPAALIVASLAVSSPGTIAQESGVLTATIYSGNCYVYDEETALFLSDLTRPDDIRVLGLPSFSESIVERDLSTLTGEMHALVIERKSSPGFVVACGEIRGNLMPDGSLAVGLPERNASFFAGVAVLTADGESTLVRTYVGGGLGRGTDTDATNEALPVDDTVLVSINDERIAADQTEFTVGSRVEFIVSNEGDRRHEVMLERAGANEEPLGDDGDQAETEDLAPGDIAVFTYTFTEAGRFQLADHIGDSTLVLEITVT